MKAPQPGLVAGTAQSGEFFEGLKHGRQPSFQQRAFDLHDIPGPDEKRDLADGVVGEECDGGRVIVGAGLGRGVDDCENSVASRWKGKRLVLNEELFSAEERGARPVDELGHIFLGMHQRVVVLAQIFVKPSTARAPNFNALILGALRKEWVIKCRGMKFMEAVLRVRADVVKEVIRVLAGGIRADQCLAAAVEQGRFDRPFPSAPSWNLRIGYHRLW